MSILANPFEADSILIVDTNAELSPSIPLQSLQTVSWRSAEGVQVVCSRKILQLALSKSLNASRKVATLSSLKQFPGRSIPEAGDHLE